MPLQTLGKAILAIGGLLVGIGILFIVFGRLGTGRLPGDLVIQKENITIYLPLASMIVISIIITIILNILRRISL